MRSRSDSPTEDERSPSWPIPCQEDKRCHLDIYEYLSIIVAPSAKCTLININGCQRKWLDLSVFDTAERRWALLQTPKLDTDATAEAPVESGVRWKSGRIIRIREKKKED